MPMNEMVTDMGMFSVVGVVSVVSVVKPARQNLRIGMIYVGKCVEEAFLHIEKILADRRAKIINRVA